MLAGYLGSSPDHAWHCPPLSYHALHTLYHYYASIIFSWTASWAFFVKLISSKLTRSAYYIISAVLLIIRFHDFRQSLVEVDCIFHCCSFVFARKKHTMVSPFFIYFMRSKSQAAFCNITVSAALGAAPV